MVHGLRETLISTHIHWKDLSAQENSEKGGGTLMGGAAPLPPRDGVEIAEELLTALMSNPRVAALVEGLN